MKMIQQIFLFLTFILVQFQLGFQQNFAVIGYLPEWRYSKIEWEGICNHLTHIILFSSEILPSGELLTQHRFPNITEMSRLQGQAKKTGSKIILGLGGNSRTNGFPQISQQKELRKIFVQNLLNFILENNLDGVDYNWEYPRNMQEWRGLLEIVRETFEVFQPLNKIITLAYYPDKHQEQILADLEFSQFIDFYNIMCYDSHNEHSTLEFAFKCVQQGKDKLPKEKLALGVPFYSRHIQNGNWLSYSEIWNKYSNILNEEMNLVDNHYFNGPSIIETKMRYSLEQQIGGIMIWEVGQDLNPFDENSLMNTISKSIYNYKKIQKNQEL